MRKEKPTATIYKDILEFDNKIKNINPCIRKELEEAIIKDPNICKALCANGQTVAQKIDAMILKSLCSKKFLDKLLGGMK